MTRKENVLNDWYIIISNGQKEVDRRKGLFILFEGDNHMVGLVWINSGCGSKLLV